MPLQTNLELEKKIDKDSAQKVMYSVNHHVYVPCDFYWFSLYIYIYNFFCTANIKKKIYIRGLYFIKNQLKKKGKKKTQRNWRWFIYVKKYKIKKE